MKPFMDADFLLESGTAQTLYHDHAAQMPIVDYHCHIDPAEIAANRQFENLAQAWLGGDHYKWRLMRACGVEERCITGDAPDEEKFFAFAKILPWAVGNPVYHWAHLELRRYFDCPLVLSEATAAEVWAACNEKLRQKDYSVRGIIKKSNVTTIVTTDDPVDDLRHHRALAAEGYETAVLPGWRPDKLLTIERAGFKDYVARLAAAAGTDALTTMAGLYAALEQRLDYFHAHGCRASDHGINAVVCAPASAAEVEAIFQKRLAGGALSAAEGDAFRWALLLFLGAQYARRGWVMELHFSAVRNLSSRGFAALGPDSGYDAIASADGMPGLAALLDALDREGQLPKTMVFSLNPNDNAAIASTIGAFSEAGVPGKLQHGTAWWFNDNLAGMVQQLTNLASMSALGNFCGMLTDSRSFLSYTRHEYFRRILCNLLGGWVERGQAPADLQALGGMVRNISYHNAMRYFGFDKMEGTQNG